MLELILFATLIISLLGMFLIFIQKASALKKLKVPKENHKPIFLTIKEKIGSTSFLSLKKVLRSDSLNIFLQKILSKIKVISLKIERKCSNYLESMRHRTKKKKENEKYWDKVGKIDLEKKKE